MLLRGARKRRRNRYGARDSRGRLAGKRMIAEQPAEAEARRAVGHREADTVAGTGNRDCVVTLVERRTGLVLIRRAGRVETVTADNGTEFHD